MGKRGLAGRSGAFYALTGDARPADHEGGSFAPLHVLVDSDTDRADPVGP